MSSTQPLTPPSGTPFDISSVNEWNRHLRLATSLGRTVVVDFWATWCGPCTAIKPKFAELAKTYPQASFLKVDVDKLQAIAQKYKVTAMPTFIVIKSGAVVDSIKGADPQGLARLIQAHAGPNPPVAPLPELAEKAKNEGNAHFKDGKWEEAIQKYSEAIELAPESFTLYSNRSFSYIKLHSSSPSSATSASAVSDALKSTTLAPTWSKGWVRLGDALSLEWDGKEQEKGKEVVKAFEEAVKLAEGTVKKEAQEKLGKAKKGLGWH